jgi:hypothetical protein
MYLGTLYIYTKFWPDRIFNMGVRPSWKINYRVSPITLELMAGSSPNVRLIRIHDIVPRFFILPTFQGHQGQSSKHKLRS